MRISDWSSDVCSSDLQRGVVFRRLGEAAAAVRAGHRGGGGGRRGVGDRRRRSGGDGLSTHDVGADGGDVTDAAWSTSRSHRPTRRSEARRVGKEGFSPCRARLSPYNYNKNKFT